MTKEEILKILENLEIAEIKNLTLEYKKEKSYGMYDNNPIIKLSIGEDK